MAMSFTVVSLVPTLESHMSAAYFGDLTVASDHETLIIAAAGFAVLGFMLVLWRRISDWSFDAMTFGQFLAAPAEARANIVFLLCGMLMISASVHFPGLLSLSPACFYPRWLSAVVKMPCGEWRFVSCWEAFVEFCQVLSSHSGTGRSPRFRPLP